MIDVIAEKDRRFQLWRSLVNENLEDIEPQKLRHLRIYGGAQGIWVDKVHTASSEIGPEGAKVAILHTGRHYADDLSDDGVIYHYPKTTRAGGSRDAAEIQATKNAMTHGLPVFVILPGKMSQSRRSLKLGWVCDFDDENQQFLILFGDGQPPTYSKAEKETSPFQLIDTASQHKTTRASVRPGQQRFRFHVLEKYGCKCAVCNIRQPHLVKAAHIRGKAQKGSDDWRNGIPLCATHHEAFDAHFFCIDPSSGVIGCKPGLNPSDIGLSFDKIRLLKNSPHIDALNWRWEATQKEWKTE
jgi:putative restriction endonuclease